MQGNCLRSALGVWQGGLTNNHANWKIKDLVWRGWVGLSTGKTGEFVGKRLGFGINLKG